MLLFISKYGKFYNKKLARKQVKSMVKLLFQRRLISCASTAPKLKGKMHTTRLIDANAGKHNIHIDNFGAGETPALVIRGYSGQSITIKLFDITSGNIVNEQIIYRADGKAKWIWWNNLPSGSYQAVIFARGISHAAKTFSVAAKTNTTASQSLNIKTKNDQKNLKKPNSKYVPNEVFLNIKAKHFDSGDKPLELGGYVSVIKWGKYKYFGEQKVDSTGYAVSTVDFPENWSIDINGLWRDFTYSHEARHRTLIHLHSEEIEASYMLEISWKKNKDSIITLPTGETGRTGVIPENIRIKCVNGILKVYLSGEFVVSGRIDDDYRKISKISILTFKTGNTKFLYAIESIYGKAL